MNDMIIKQLFLLCLSAALYGTIMGAIVWALGKLLKKQLPASAMFMFWVIVTVRFLLPFAPESRFSMFNLLPGGAETVNPETGSRVLESAGISAVAPVGVPVVSICAVIWFVVCAAVFLWFAVPQIIMQIQMSLRPSGGDGRISKILDECSRRLRISRRVSYVFQTRFKTPALIGFLRPKILLTDEVLAFPDEEIKYIFMHELCHMKRRDILYKYLVIIVRSLHWFNPLVWHFTACAMRDAELATDEKVMMYIGAGENKDYGRAILNTSARLSIHRFGAVMGMADKRSNLRRRIIKISKFKRPCAALRIIGVTAVLVLGFTGLTNAKLPEALQPEPLFGGIAKSFSPDERGFSPEEPISAESEPRRETELYAFIDETEEEPYYEETSVKQTISVPDGGQARSDAGAADISSHTWETVPQTADGSRPEERTTVTESGTGAETQTRDDADSVFASRNDLLPGTTIDDVESEHRGAKRRTVTTGDNSISVKSGDDGTINFYIDSRTSDMIGARIVSGSGETLNRIYFTPRAYNSYTIKGLSPGGSYTLEIHTSARAEILYY